MLIYFTDAMTQKSIAINPTHVIAALESPNNEEIRRMEDEMISSYSLPVLDMIG